MANLSHLKIDQSPAAFAEFAAKHNAMVALIESIEGRMGVDIKIVANQPKKLHVPKTPSPARDNKGRIIISNKATSPIPPNIAAAPSATGVGSDPFEIVVVSSGGAYVGTFFSGTFNGVAPTNIGSTFSIGTGTQYAILTGTAVDGVWSSSALSISATPPSPIGLRLGFPPNTIPLLLYVIVDGNAFRVTARTSYIASSVEQFRVQKSMTTPDMLPYDSYYTWVISGV